MTIHYCKDRFHIHDHRTVTLFLCKQKVGLFKKKNTMLYMSVRTHVKNGPNEKCLKENLLDHFGINVDWRVLDKILLTFQLYMLNYAACILKFIQLR